MRAVDNDDLAMIVAFLRQDPVTTAVLVEMPFLSGMAGEEARGQFYHALAEALAGRLDDDPDYRRWRGGCCT